MAVYIKGIGMLSAQSSLRKDWLQQLVPVSDKKFASVIEPEYEKYLDVRQLRRMSRILKAGVTAAYMALEEAKTEKPDFIITGTGLGCMEDTGQFLTGMIAKDEQALNPTPFIQSTHNTIGSSIALALNCHGYNQTYVHGNLCFEHALQDAMMLMNEQPELLTGLVGAVDEQTELSRSVFSSIENSKVADCAIPYGEGMTYLSISSEKTDDVKVSIEDVATFFEPETDVLKQGVKSFMTKNKMQTTSPDVVMLASLDNAALSNKIATELFPNSVFAYFKHLCGEYYSASAFATSLAARIIESKLIPDEILLNDKKVVPNSVLIFNQSGESYYSLILLKAC